MRVPGTDDKPKIRLSASKAGKFTRHRVLLPSLAPLVLPFAFAPSAAAATLDISSGSLPLNFTTSGAFTDSSSYSNALSVPNVGSNLTGPSSVLVISTFSSQYSGPGNAGLEAKWRLSDGTNFSTPISRGLENKQDTGMASTVHIFENVSASSTISLQHASTGTGDRLFTAGANLVAIPLTTVEGDLLQNDLVSQTTPFGTTSNTFQVVTGLATPAVTVNTVGSNNSFLVAASFNTEGGGAVTGEWQLQYRGDGGAWTNIGSPVRRSMSDTSDTGAATKYAVADGLSAGDYEFRLMSRSLDGATEVNTLNGSVAVTALSFDGGYFPVAKDSGSLSDGDGSTSIDEGTEVNVSVAQGENVALTSFTATIGGNNQDILFDIFEGNNPSAPVSSNQAIERIFQSGESGSGGSVGIFNPSSTTATLGVRSRNGTLSSSSGNLISFSTTSTTAIPEVSTRFAFFSLLFVFAVTSRRRLLFFGC